MCVCVCACMLSHFSCAQLFVTPWTVAHQAPLSMRFSRQEYWSELPCPPPGDLPNPGIKPSSPALLDSLLSKTPGKSKNRVGSLSLLKGIFPTQELNWSLLHCRQILYQRATREAPHMCISSVVKSGPTLCYSMDCSTPGFPVYHQLPELTQTHVH